MGKKADKPPVFVDSQNVEEQEESRTAGKSGESVHAKPKEKRKYEETFHGKKRI